MIIGNFQVVLSRIVYRVCHKSSVRWWVRGSSLLICYYGLNKIRVFSQCLAILSKLSSYIYQILRFGKNYSKFEKRLEQQSSSCCSESKENAKVNPKLISQYQKLSTRLKLLWKWVPKTSKQPRPTSGKVKKKSSIKKPDHKQKPTEKGLYN